MGAENDNKRKRRLPAAQRRRMITEATLRCLARHGVERTSVREICAEADVSVGLINYYYDGKEDRKSTRLNSSHVSISYAVFCLKKKRKDTRAINSNTTARRSHARETPPRCSDEG